MYHTVAVEVRLATWIEQELRCRGRHRGFDSRGLLIPLNGDVQSNIFRVIVATLGGVIDMEQVVRVDFAWNLSCWVCLRRSPFSP